MKQKDQSWESHIRENIQTYTIFLILILEVILNIPNTQRP